MSLRDESRTLIVVSTSRTECLSANRCFLRPISCWVYRLRYHTRSRHASYRPGAGRRARRNYLQSTHTPMQSFTGAQANPKKPESNRTEFTCLSILTFLPMTGPVNVTRKKVVEDKVFRNGCKLKRLGKRAWSVGQNKMHTHWR